MGFRYRPNPTLENQIGEEARLLMEQEGSAWHPPLVYPPQEMPNVPRDPVVEAKKKKALEAALRGQVKAPAILPSQNPFAQPGPTSDEMAQASAAVKLSTMPVEAKTQPEVNFPTYPEQPVLRTDNPQNDFAPTIERAGTQQIVDRPSDLPGMEDNPKPPAETDGASKPGQSALRDSLVAKAMGDKEETRQPTYSSAYIDALKQNGMTDRNIALMALMAKGANQMGTVGGRVADSSGLDQFQKVASQANAAPLNAWGESETQWIKGANKQGDPTTKLLLELVKLQEANQIAKMRNETTKEGNASRTKVAEASLAQQGRLGDILAGDRDASREQTGTIAGANIQLAKDRLNLEKEKFELEKTRPKKANLPIGVPEVIDDKVKRISKREAMIGKLESTLKTFMSAKTDKEKLDYGNSLIKLMNDPENPDAAGVEEANRAGANLKIVRPGETLDWIFGDGEAPAGRNFDGFAQQMRNMIKTMRGNNESEKRSLQEVYDKNGIPNGVTSDGSGGYLPLETKKTEVKRQYSESRKQTKIFYSDGTTEVINGK